MEIDGIQLKSIQLYSKSLNGNSESEGHTSSSVARFLYMRVVTEDTYLVSEEFQLCSYRTYNAPVQV